MRLESFSPALAVTVAALVSACDPTVCSRQSCGDGLSWDRCINCAYDSCLYEARTSDGETFADCSYDQSTDVRDRDECFKSTNAAGELYCSGLAPSQISGEPTNSGGCSIHSDCGSCVSDACSWCPSSGQCLASDAAGSCSTTVLDGNMECVNGVAYPGCGFYHPQQLPPGSYRQSCRNMTVIGTSRIQAECRASDQTYTAQEFDFRDCIQGLVNENGRLRCTRC